MLLTLPVSAAFLRIMAARESRSMAVTEKVGALSKPPPAAV